MSKSPTTKCQTPFEEKSGDRKNAWLGNPRLANGIPSSGFPPRARCYQVTSEKERDEANRLLRELKEAERLYALHDIAGRTERLRELSRNNAEWAAVESEKLRRELASCDHAQFEAARADLKRLREESARLATAILNRLITSFDDELNQCALEAEERLKNLSIALFEDVRDTAGYLVRRWTLHADPPCVALQCRRELARNRTHWLEKTCDGISEIGFLATDQDEFAAFSWL